MTRFSLRRCSREAAVRFTSWLLDRTRCSTGNNETHYLWDRLVGVCLHCSGFSWWCLVVLFFFFLLCADLRWPPWSSGYHCKIRPSALCSRHVKPLWSTIELVKNPPAGKKLEFIVPSSTTDAWITALTPGHDFQHKHTSTEIQRYKQLCQRLFSFVLRDVSPKPRASRGRLFWDFTWTPGFKVQSVRSAPGFFFSFFQESIMT